MTNSKPVFTMRHYNRIHNVIKTSIESFKNDSTMISDEDIYYIAGMRTIHDNLGKLFEKDNPKFKSNLWEL